MKLILASASVGRKKLLEQLKVPFKVIPSVLAEEKIIGKTPVDTLKLRAKLKGEDVYRKILKSKIINHKSLLVLSADSGAIINHQLIGKPKDYQDGVRILKSLSGKTHRFVTAVCLIKISNLKNQKFGNRLGKAESTNFGDLSSRQGRSNQYQTGYLAQENTTYEEGKVSEKFGTETLPIFDTSLVTFRKLSDNDIKRYLSITNYRRFAGGYAIASAQDFIIKIEGSISNVIGLPLEKIIPILKEYKIL